MKNILCFHHDDLDGTMSKAILNFYNKSHIIKYVSCMNPHDTDWNIDYSQYDEIYVADLCFAEYIFQEILAETEMVGTEIYVCDHHESGKPIVDKLEKKSMRFKSITSNWNNSASLNLYNHFVELYGIDDFGGEEFDRGYIVDAVNQFDTWTFEHGSKTHCLCLFLVSMDVNHTTFFNHPRLPEGISAGEILVNALDFTVNELIDSDRFFYGSMDDKKTICINGVPLNVRSYLLNKALDKFDVDIAVHFMYYPSCIVVSLRSKQDSDVNVAEIAKVYGGGGHKNAAGFSVPRESDITQLLGLENNNVGPQENSI